MAAGGGSVTGGTKAGRIARRALQSWAATVSASLRLNERALLLTECSALTAPLSLPRRAGRSTACPTCTSWELPSTHGCSNLGCTARTSTASTIGLAGAYAARSARRATGAGGRCRSRLAPLLLMAA